MTSYEQGYLNLKEAERRALVSGLLKEEYSSIPFYRQNAKDDPDYWAKLASRVANRFATARYRGRSIPYIEHPIRGWRTKD